MDKLINIFNENKFDLVICRGQVGYLLGIVDDGEDYYYVLKNIDQISLISCVEKIIPLVDLKKEDKNFLNARLKGLEPETLIDVYNEISEQNYKLITEWPKDLELK